MMQAMMLGLPVIATNYSASCEVCVWHVVCVLCVCMYDVCVLIVISP